MKILLCYVVVSLALFQNSYVYCQKSKSLNIILGRQFNYKTSYIPSNELKSDQSIVSYEIYPEKKLIIFHGLRPGESEIHLTDVTGEDRELLKVKVNTNAQAQTLKELNDFLGDIEGLEIGTRGGKVYLGGELVVPEDYTRILIVLDKYPDVIRLIRLSENTQKILANKITEELKKVKITQVNIKIVNRSFWLQGYIQNEGQRELMFKIINGVLPEKLLQILDPLIPGDSGQAAGKQLIVDFVEVKESSQSISSQINQIQVILNFVELAKDYSKVFGMKWVPTLSGGGGSIDFGGGVNKEKSQSGIFSGAISNLLPQLESAKGAGEIRLLESGMIILKEGVQGKIKKTKTIPYLLGEGEFSRPMSFTTGFDLAVTGKLVADGKIELSLATNVQIQSGENSSTQNSVETIVVVNSNESAVIGGISFDHKETNFDRDPPGGKSVVDSQTGSALFSFVRSKNRLLSKTQFAIFITPRIVSNTDSITKKIQGKFSHY